jgi:hypothetical protein
LGGRSKNSLPRDIKIILPLALETLKGKKTLQELVITYSVHPNMIALWKKHILEHASMLLEKGGKHKASA